MIGKYMAAARGGRNVASDMPPVKPKAGKAISSQQAQPDIQTTQGSTHNSAARRGGGSSAGFNAQKKAYIEHNKGGYQARHHGGRPAPRERAQSFAPIDKMPARRVTDSRKSGYHGLRSD